MLSFVLACSKPDTWNHVSGECSGIHPRVLKELVSVIAGYLLITTKVLVSLERSLLTTVTPILEEGCEERSMELQTC